PPVPSACIAQSFLPAIVGTGACHAPLHRSCPRALLVAAHGRGPVGAASSTAGPESGTRGPFEAPLAPRMGVGGGRGGGPPTARGHERAGSPATAPPALCRWAASRRPTARPALSSRRQPAPGRRAP